MPHLLLSFVEVWCGFKTKNAGANHSVASSTFSMMSFEIRSWMIFLASWSQCKGIALADVVKTGSASFLTFIFREWPFIFEKSRLSEIVLG